MEETLRELDELFAEIDDTSRGKYSLESKNEGESRKQSLESENECEQNFAGDQAEFVEATAGQGVDDPLSQFLDLSCEGASDALERIQRNSSINDPDNMELGHGKIKNVTENAIPSRSA